MRTARGAAALALALAATALLAHPAAGAELSGVVFLDENANGARDPGEPGRAGVVVSNGRELVRTGADGSYRLPARDGFVFVTRPAGFDAAVWYRETGGDFALVPRADGDGFFVHLSDAHVYEDRNDFATYSSPLPWWVPELVAYPLMAWRLQEIYGAERFRASLERALGGGEELAALGDGALLRRFTETWAEPETALGDVAGAARAAFAEVAAFAPDFVVSTGDLVLEGNQGDPEAVERWFRFYATLVRGTGAPFYHTIGNNELAGTANDDFPADDPRFGRHFFHRFLGPSHYSFDRGRFHFVALDTHRASPDGDGWEFGRMEEDVARWLAADLDAHRDRVLVVLNHEPFHFDPSWPFDEDPAQRAHDLGLFSRTGVDYVLSGHTHFGSHRREGGVVHTTAGALSGMRWLLPAELHERGYRLAVLRDDRLFSAWKRLGAPVAALADGPARAGERVVAFAEADGAYAGIEARLAGRALPLERWGPTFARIELPADAAPGELELLLRRRDGTPETVRLPLAAPR